MVIRWINNEESEKLMSKFKVGDELEYIYNGEHYWYRGRRFIVTKITKSSGYTWYHNSIGSNTSEGTLKLHKKGEPMSLRSRIEALDNGWDKEADDILQEVQGNYKLRVLQDKEYGWVQTFAPNKSIIESNDRIEEYRFDNQCEKMTAFKDALLWLLDKSGLEGYKKGDTIKIESEGKTYQVKILKEV